MLVHEKLFDYLNRNGITPASAAEKAGYSTTAFEDILSGKRTMYSEDLEQICWALDVDPNGLLGME